MILVLSGTGDGRTIVKKLVQKGYKVLATASTSYGGQLLAEATTEISAHPLNEHDLIKLIVDRGITSIIDTTHPYAEMISKLAIKICLENNLTYIRYERPELELPEHPLLIQTANYHQAAEKSVSLGKNIFLTTGSKTLDIFMRLAQKKERRIIARVLPNPQIMKRCLDLGLTPKDIVAMQGPFTKELNLAMLRQYQASVLVTKNSGSVGGLDAKIEAALEFQIPVVIINRPKPLTSNSVSNIAELFQELEKLDLN